MPRSKSLFIESEGADHSSIKSGFEWLIANSRANRKNPLIALNIKKNLDALSSFIDEHTIRNLKARGSVTLSGGLELSMNTIRDHKDVWDGPVLVLWPTKKLLDKIDSMYEVTEALVIPWGLETVRPWIRMWNAKVLGQECGAEDITLVGDHVVEEELERLTRTINLSTGIGHPSDRKHAIETFLKLKHDGHIFDSEQVRAWLIAKGGWQPRHADDVKRIVQAVLEGRRLKY